MVGSTSIDSTGWSSTTPRDCPGALMKSGVQATPSYAPADNPRTASPSSNATPWSAVTTTSELSYTRSSWSRSRIRPSSRSDAWSWRRWRTPRRARHRGVGPRVEGRPSRRPLLVVLPAGEVVPWLVGKQHVEEVEARRPAGPERPDELVPGAQRVVGALGRRLRERDRPLGAVGPREAVPRGPGVVEQTPHPGADAHVGPLAVLAEGLRAQPGHGLGDVHVVGAAEQREEVVRVARRGLDRTGAIRMVAGEDGGHGHLRVAGDGRGVAVPGRVVGQRGEVGEQLGVDVSRTVEQRHLGELVHHDHDHARVVLDAHVRRRCRTFAEHRVGDR